MKHIVKEVHNYRNFNESEAVQVTTLSARDDCAAGLSLYRDGYNCSLFLKDATLTYVVTGKKYMLLDKQEFYLQAGDLLYIPANSVVFTDIPKTQKPFQSFNILVTAELLKSTGHLKQGGFLTLKKSPFLISQDQAIMAGLASFLDAHEQAGATAGYKNRLAGILKLIKNDLFETASGKTNDPCEAQAISNVLIPHIYQPLSLSQLAAKNNMSLATFKRKFKIAFGQSPKTWLRNIRLQAAYFHLKTNTGLVSDISSFVGFENFAHFSHAFKKYFHIRPSSLLQTLTQIR